jgi:acetyl-CoA carboxylase biotin carboxylase subunit
MIKKILVANRGEIALRIFRTCRVMNITTVAIYTHADRGSLHVRYADEAYCISDGPDDISYLKPDIDTEDSQRDWCCHSSGLRIPVGERRLCKENVRRNGVIFIGPSADIIARMGIKTEARKVMREAGLAYRTRYGAATQECFRRLRTSGKRDWLSGHAEGSCRRRW